MGDKHIFIKDTDSEPLAMEIVTFLRKWGLWQDVQIFTGGKCYTDEHGELVVRSEEHPEKYLEGNCPRGGSGKAEGNCPRGGSGKVDWQDFSNPERLLDMTFEGPFSLLLRHHEYEVKLENVSDEVKPIIMPETEEYQDDEVTELMAEYLEGNYSWDPAEYDSYEEWLELSQYCDMDLFGNEEYNNTAREIEFSSREDYEDHLMYHAARREQIITEYFEDELNDAAGRESEEFYDSGRIADMIIGEFNDLLEKYGLWYELCFSWSLTTYRI